MYKIYGLTTEFDKEIQYIGLTSKTLEHRLNQHIRTSHIEKDFYSKKENWIRKRIEDGYEIKILELESNLTKEEACDLEIAWISYFGLENLRNTTIGGECGSAGKVFSLEERINWYNSIEVTQYSLDGKLIKEFPNITQCAKELNISHSSIWYCINNKHVTSHGFIFVQSDYKEDLYKKLEILKNRESRCELYDIYGNLIDSSNSINNLNKKYGFTQRLTEFSKRLNDGIVPKVLKESYFIKFPNFNLDVMLNSLKRFKIINIESKEILYFTTIEDIYKFLKCSKSLVTDCLSKIKKSANGWQIYHINDEVEEYSRINNRKIIELDLSGNIIKTFNNIKECANYYNIDSSCISKVCRGKRKHVKHHIFKYIDDIV